MTGAHEPAEVSAHGPLVDELVAENARMRSVARVALALFVACAALFVAAVWMTWPTEEGPPAPPLSMPKCESYAEEGRVAFVDDPNDFSPARTMMCQRVFEWRDVETVRVRP